MAKLKPGALIVDLVDGSIHGDLNHCPREDLLESAQALLSLLPTVRHKGLWGLGKAFDAGCYLFTADRRYRLPEGLNSEADIHSGPLVDDPEFPRGGSVSSFRLAVLPSDRETYWRYDWHSRLVGSVQGSKVSPDTEGKPSHYKEPPSRTVPNPTPSRRRVSERSSGGTQPRLL